MVLGVVLLIVGFLAKCRSCPGARAPSCPTGRPFNPRGGDLHVSRRTGAGWPRRPRMPAVRDASADLVLAPNRLASHARPAGTARRRGARQRRAWPGSRPCSLRLRPRPRRPASDGYAATDPQPSSNDCTSPLLWDEPGPYVLVSQRALKYQSVIGEDRFPTPCAEFVKCPRKLNITELVAQANIGVRLPPVSVTPDHHILPCVHANDLCPDSAMVKGGDGSTTRRPRPAAPTSRFPRPSTTRSVWWRLRSGRHRCGSPARTGSAPLTRRWLPSSRLLAVRARS